MFCQPAPLELLSQNSILCALYNDYTTAWSPLLTLLMRKRRKCWLIISLHNCNKAFQSKIISMRWIIHRWKTAVFTNKYTADIAAHWSTCANGLLWRDVCLSLVCAQKLACFENCRKLKWWLADYFNELMDYNWVIMLSCVATLNLWSIWTKDVCIARGCGVIAMLTRGMLTRGMHATPVLANFLFGIT